MIDFSRLLDPKFIFNPGLSSLSPGFAKIAYITFGLCLVLAIVAYLIKREQEKKKNLPLAKLWQKLNLLFLTLGIVGLLLLFFRQQHVYFLSMPFLWYLLLLGIIVWVVFIIRWVKTRMKKIQQEIKEKQEKQKYLP